MNQKRLSSLVEGYSSGPGSSAAGPAHRRPESPHQSDYCAPVPSGRLWNVERSLFPENDSSLDQDEPLNLSCVTKETSQHDCARHRFIVWAAVKRNLSPNLPQAKKLECPLLRCELRFSDHEAMLRHLAGCKYLAEGEYWCFDHQRVERFNDVKCKRCLGHPSKRRKILNLAKNFFHSLGHKSKKASASEIDVDAALSSPLLTYYDSLNIKAVNDTPSELPTTTEIAAELEAAPVNHTPDWIFESAPEPVFAPFAPDPTDSINPQALFMPPTTSHVELDSAMAVDGTFAQWQLPSVSTPTTMASALMPLNSVSTEDGFPKNSLVKPTLQVITEGLQGRRQAPRPKQVPPAQRSKTGLSPSSSVRSTASTDTTATTASYGSSLISPSSNWSGVWSMGSGFDTHATSPIDGVTFDDMFDTEMHLDHNPCPDYLHLKFCELPGTIPDVSQKACETALDPINDTEDPVPTNPTPIPEIRLQEEQIVESIAPVVPVALTESEEREVGPESVCCSEATSLVSSVWDAFMEHVVSSAVKIQDQRDVNVLAKQFNGMACRTIVTRGLHTLRAFIAKTGQLTATDLICFLHLIGSFKVVLREQDASKHFNNLFLQALAYSSRLPQSDRDVYRQLVKLIWQPPTITQEDVQNYKDLIARWSFGSPFDVKGKAPEVLHTAHGQRMYDPLLATAQDFLDALEMSVVHSCDSLPLGVQVSDLNIVHLKEANALDRELVATVQSVMEVLSRGFRNHELLNNGLRRVSQRVFDGSISGVRKIELALLKAGKDSLPRERFFDEYVPRVRKLCDQVYEKHEEGVSQRDKYHVLGIELIEKLIHDFDTSSSKAKLSDALDAGFLEDAISETIVQAAQFSNVSTSSPKGPRSPYFNTQLPTPTETSINTPSNSSSSGDAERPQPQQAPPAAQSPSQLGTQGSQRQPRTTGQQKEVVEADLCCKICGYRPKGHPQWFKGSMSKHMRTQHRTETEYFYCNFPGCTSKFRNRADNLRKHKMEKNHWCEEDLVPATSAASSSSSVQTAAGSRRPSKRKKMADDHEQ